MQQRVQRLADHAREGFARNSAWLSQVRRAGLAAMIRQTRNFENVTWMGRPVWQNPLDAWLLQETIVETEVDFIIECGTNRGGSALYMAGLFDLMDRGHIVTIDVEKLHDNEHPRVDFLIGSSVDSDVVAQVQRLVEEHAPERILVILDSDHSSAHVMAELDAYAEFVTIGCHMFVQDGCIDELPMFAQHRPGPLDAINKFLAVDRRFMLDEERSNKYLQTHHPKGWLRRVS